MLGVFSCQKDDSFNDSTITKPAKNNVIVKRVTLDEIKTNNQLQKTLNKIDKYLDVSKSKDTNSRIYSNDGSFVILTDEIAQAITHNSEAYTFKIETPILPEATFENLIIEKRENQDKFYFYIYSYKTITLANNTEFTFVISIKKIDEDIINMDDFYDTINSSIVMVNGCMYFTDDHGNSELIWCFGSNAGGSSNEGSTGISGPQVNIGDWVYFSYGSEGCYRTRTFSVLDSYNTYEDEYGDASWHNVTEIEHNVPCPNGIGWNNDGTTPGNNGGYDNEENDPHFNDGFTPIGSSGGSTTPSNNNNSTVVTLSSPPRNFAQELFTCFSGAGMLVNISDLTFFQQRDLAYYLGRDNNNDPFDNSGTNCSDPQALAFAYQAYLAMLEGGDVDFDDIIYVLENEQDYTGWMSDDEKNLFDTLTRTEQLLYLVSAKEAYDETEDLYLTPCERHNGRGDAFRHAYWNALSSSRIGVGLTNLLTTRHENQPLEYPYHSKENNMDLFNNQVGRDIITNGSTNILQDIQDAVNNGDLRYLNNQDSNCFATFSSQLIPTNQ